MLGAANSIHCTLLRIEWKWSGLTFGCDMHYIYVTVQSHNLFVLTAHRNGYVRPISYCQPLQQAIIFENHNNRISIVTCLSVYMYTFGNFWNTRCIRMSLCLNHFQKNFIQIFTYFSVLLIAIVCQIFGSAILFFECFIRIKAILDMNHLYLFWRKKKPNDSVRKSFFIFCSTKNCVPENIEFRKKYWKILNTTQKIGGVKCLYFYIHRCEFSCAKHIFAFISHSSLWIICWFCGFWLHIWFVRWFLHPARAQYQ